MVDKRFCMSSFLAFRYIIDDEREFQEGIKHRIYKMLPEKKKTPIYCSDDIIIEIKKQIDSLLKNNKVGLLLSGGMDSGCLAPFLHGCDAYTFRFENVALNDEIKRAEYYSQKWGMKLHFVDISWNRIEECVDPIISSKGAPVHSIEPQIFLAAEKAKSDGIMTMVIGDAADYVFGGMDKLYSKDWEYDDFKRRYTYINPKDVLIDPVDMDFAFKKYKIGNNIDFVSLMHNYTDVESYASYENAFHTAGMNYVDPYENMKLGRPLDLIRIRNGESKYLIRELFKSKYPEIPVPEKIPMPRPVDYYFKDWEGPERPEFKKNLDMSKFSGNQKWQLWCLERFLNMIDN